MRCLVLKSLCEIERSVLEVNEHIFWLFSSGLFHCIDRNR